MNDPVLRSTHLLDILPQDLPWIRFLPTDGRIEFAQELVEVWEAVWTSVSRARCCC